MAMIKKPAPKKPVAPRTPVKGVKVTMPKTGPSSKKKNMPLTGPAAIKAIQKRTSPSGVKKAEAGAKKAIDKKYPGLYKDAKTTKATKEVTGKVNKSKESTVLSPKEKAGLKKGIDKIVSDSKKKAKMETQKRKAPDSNWIARM